MDLTDDEYIRTKKTIVLNEQYLQNERERLKETMSKDLIDTILSACEAVTDGMRYDVAEYEKKQILLKE